MRWALNHKRKVIGSVLVAGVVILALAIAPVVMNPGSSGDAAACNPNYFTDDDLARIFRGHPDMNGHSWATPYTFNGNVTSGWTFWETTSHVLIQNCTFDDSAWGLRLWETTHLRVINCTFVGATRGIWAHLTRDLLVIESSFFNNEYGMDLWRTSNATITRNEFEGKHIGIRASSCSSNIQGYYNHFDAEVFAADIASPSVLIQRNFYADYFTNHPTATMNLADPEAGYCSFNEGAPFPLSEPVTLGSLGVDSRPLWWVPNVAPSITITHPTGGSYHRMPPVLEVTFGGTVIVNASYTLNGIQFAITLPSTPTHMGTTSMLVEAPTFTALAEGDSLIIVGATSWFGMTGLTSGTFHKDTIAPVFSLETPANRSTHANPPVITLNVTDASPCTISYACAGNTRSATLPTFTFDSAIWASQAEGEVPIQIAIFDAAGNSASLAASYIKDVTGPVIAAEWIGATALAGAVPPAFNVTATDPADLGSLIQCSFGGVTWSVASGSTTVIPSGVYTAIPDGPFSVIILARDALNNPTFITLEGEKDSIFDTLEVITPMSGAVVSAIVVPYFAIRAEDSHGVVSIWVSLEGGMTRYSVTPIGYLPASEWSDVAVPGCTVTVTFDATDAAGNNATVTIVLNVAPTSEVPAGDECTEWWCSALFWAGMAIGMLALAIFVAIKAASVGRQAHSRRAPDNERFG